MGSGTSSKAAAVADDDELLTNEYRLLQLKGDGCSVPTFKAWKKQLKVDPQKYAAWRAALEAAVCARKDAEAQHRVEVAALERAQREREAEAARDQEVKRALESRCIEEKKAALAIKQAQDRALLLRRIEQCETAVFLDDMAQIREMMRLHTCLGADGQSSATDLDRLRHPSFGQALAIAMLDSEKPTQPSGSSKVGTQSGDSKQADAASLGPLVDTLERPRQIFEIVAMVLFNRRRFTLSHYVGFCSLEAAFLSAPHATQTRVFDATLAHQLASESCWTIVKALIESQLDVTVSRHVIHGNGRNSSEVACLLHCSWDHHIARVMQWRSSAKTSQAGQAEIKFDKVAGPSAPKKELELPSSLALAVPSAPPPPYDLIDDGRSQLIVEVSADSGRLSASCNASGGPTLSRDEPHRNGKIAVAGVDKELQLPKRPFFVEICLGAWPSSVLHEESTFSVQVMNDPAAATYFLSRAWGRSSPLKNIWGDSTSVIPVDPATLCVNADVLHLRVARVISKCEYTGQSRTEHLRVPIPLENLERVGQYLVSGEVSLAGQGQYGHYVASNPGPSCTQLSVRMRRKFRL